MRVIPRSGILKPRMWMAQSSARRGLSRAGGARESSRPTTRDTANRSRSTFVTSPRDHHPRAGRAARPPDAGYRSSRRDPADRRGRVAGEAGVRFGEVCGRDRPVADEASAASCRTRGDNVVIWLAFAAELAAILYVTPRRWRWMREHPLEPMIVLLTPPIMPASLQAARVLRLLRLSRLVRLAQVARSLGGGATCSASSPGTPELCRAAAPMRSSKPRP